MTIGILIPGADFSGAQFFVNRNPLPPLPAGLERLHLTRRSLSQMGRDLVGLSSTLTQEAALGGGAVEYTDFDIRTDRRGTGWHVNDYTATEANGTTFMCVVGGFGSANDFWMQTGTGDIAAEDTIRLRSNWTISTFRTDAKTPAGSASAEVSGVGGRQNDYFAGFGGVNETHAFAFVPDLNSYTETALAGPTGPILPGLSLCRFGTSSSADTARMALWAAWDRALSQSEMTDAYNALKPWLANVGVEIL